MHSDGGKRQSEALARLFGSLLDVRLYSWDVLTSARFRQRAIFDAKSVEKLLIRHQNATMDYSPIMWALVILEAWANAYLEGPAYADGQSLVVGEEAVKTPSTPLRWSLRRKPGGVRWISYERCQVLRDSCRSNYFELSRAPGLYTVLG